jgi:hypothetical protein
MAKRIKILIMIFCLGIFIIPKQLFFAQKQEIACCEKEKPEKSCCEKSNGAEPCDSNKSHSCDGNCTNCKACSTSVVFLAVEIKTEIEKQNVLPISKQVENSYLQPSISQLPKKIWQPPKIS